ncbi:MAG: hypothetical protein JST54_11080 [Deltaproteobacteria bacterium]|nr:hypothetical protein [Deltaproteobacteria bacterium]
MLDSFRDGGFGMFPTLIFGLVLVALSVRYAAKPEQRQVPLLISMGLLTNFAGALGFVMGVITTMKAVGQVPAEEHWIAMLGVGESLNNMALAFALCVMATLCVVIGAWRLSTAAANGVTQTAR